MRLFFRKIRFKNLLAYGNYFTEIDLENYHTNLLTAQNGAGKTSIIDALCFGLFRKPFRDINISELVNVITNKDLLVEIEFDTGGKSYLVRQGVKPNIFEIYCDGELQNQNSSSKDYQKILENNILKCNYKSFCQIVVLGASTYVQFMKLDAASRRDIVEDLLDLKIFTTMDAILKNEIKNVKKEIEENRKEKSSSEYFLKFLNETVQQQNESRELAIENCNQEITDYQKNIDKKEEVVGKLREKISEFKNNEEDIRKIEKKLEDAVSIKASLEAKKDLLKKNSKVFLEHKNCPLCRQNIGDHLVEEQKTKFEKENSEYSNALEKIAEKISKFRDNRNKIRKLETEKNDLKFSLNKEEEILNSNRKYLLNTRKELEKLQNPTETQETNLEHKLEETNSKIEVLDQSYNSMNEAMEHKKYSVAILPEIKTSIIDEFIPVFNEQIQIYLDHFDSMIKFEIDGNFKERIVHLGREKLGYNSLSEGEKFRVNISLLFAWREVAKIRGSISCNILFMDEILDGSLDDDGVSDFMRIIRGLDQDTSIFLISHKKHESFDLFDRRINVIKRANFAQVEFV